MSIEQIGLVVLSFVVILLIVMVQNLTKHVWNLRVKAEVFPDYFRSIRHRVGALEYKSRTKVTTTASVNPGKPKIFKIKPTGRTPRLYSFEGIRHPIKEWAQLVGMSKKTLYKRVYKGLPLLTPEEFARISKGVQ